MKSYFSDGVENASKWSCLQLTLGTIFKRKDDFENINLILIKINNCNQSTKIKE